MIPEYANQGSSWGPDFMWCAAASEWWAMNAEDKKDLDSNEEESVHCDHPHSPACNLIPLISKHDDDCKMTKGSKFLGVGDAMLETFRENRSSFFVGIAYNSKVSG